MVGTELPPHSSRNLHLGEGERAEQLAGVLDVAAKRAKHHHAAVEGAEALVGQDGAHVEELLLAVDVDAALDLILSHQLTASAVVVVGAIRQVERADLLARGFLVNDLDEQK